MFDVRRFSPRLLTILTVAGLGLLGLVATAAPASAHTGHLSRSCSDLTVHLTNFRGTEQHPSVVTLTFTSKAGTTTNTVTFAGTGTDKTYAMASDLVVNVHAEWKNTGSDHNSGSFTDNSPAPGDCNTPPPCATKRAISYTFDGPAGTATVTVRGEAPLCEAVTVLLVSYKTQGPTWETSGHQTVFDQDSKVIQAAGTYSLKVTVPDCNTQDDLYVTDKKPADFDFPNDTLGRFLASIVWHGMPSAWNGGTKDCTVTTPTPTPTPTPTTSPTAVSPTSAAPPAAAPPGTSLPNTGASPMPKILLAIVLLGAGTGLAFLGRRRRRTS